MVTESEKKRRRAYLFALISATNTPQEVGDLMTDLLTPTEMESLSARAAIATMMNQQTAAKIIAADLDVASGSVTKVHDVFKTGAKGYRTALKNLQAKQTKQEIGTKQNQPKGKKKVR